MDNFNIPSYPKLALIKNCICVVVFLFSLITHGTAQDQEEDLYSLNIVKNLAIGYVYSSSENATKDYHLLELEYWDTKYTSRHYMAFCKYAGLELGLNTNDLVVGPKVGASLNYGPFILGLESILYTDFKQGTFRIAPVFGYGTHLLKLSFSYQIKITNRDFNIMNPGQLNVAFRFATLKKEKREFNKL